MTDSHSRWRRNHPVTQLLSYSAPFAHIALKFGGALIYSLRGIYSQVRRPFPIICQLRIFFKIFFLSLRHFPYLPLWLLMLHCVCLFVRGTREPKPSSACSNGIEVCPPTSTNCAKAYEQLSRRLHSSTVDGSVWSIVRVWRTGKQKQKLKLQQKTCLFPLSPLSSFICFSPIIIAVVGCLARKTNSIPLALKVAACMIATTAARRKSRGTSHPL